ncbi:MAG: outer membrane protein OmpW [Thalassolituus maritimus]|uniref:Outer membrane protein n=1 Tax=Thalassolituus maritimus TaxID=484498 RepID=A0A1N7P9E6_9GAMM|nr:OmpW family outer membrane protein [Thalassolituus maritimus]TPD54298.1 MAG: outer membrane protein OmpW [Thalassolituus maritimus]SIT07178.1 outer membrane protein [Thalassolituus maritimus]
MKLMKTLIAGAVSMAFLPAVPAFAYEAGDIIVKAGVINVIPKDGNADTSALVPDSELDIDSNIQLGLTGVYMVNQYLGVELLAATPFEHTAEGDGGAIDGADVLTTKHLPPTLSAQYYPMGADSAIQPYVGLGVNYTFFFDEEDDAGLGSNGLKPSFGLAYSAGVDYMINDNWLVNASVWKVDIDTEVKGGAADGLEVEIDPIAFMVACGYKF